MPRETLIQLRRGTQAEWDADNPVLAMGEIGFAVDTGTIKIGNGIDTWTERTNAASDVATLKLDNLWANKNVTPFNLPDGAESIVGPTGPPGPSGPMGPEGPPGADGSNGADGSVGPQGEQGEKGEVGQTGAKGADGVDGGVGPMGSQGSKGSDGADGAVGPIGPTGLQGDRGIQGPAGVNGADGSVGERGPQGLPGAKGDNGADGAVGPAGPEGAAGPRGEAGANGSDGVQGPEGPAGTAGTRGPKGDVGDTGPAGPAGPQGIQGFQGAKGDIGDTGPQGIQGEAAGINVKGTAVSWPPDVSPEDADLWILPDPTPAGTPVEYNAGDGVIWNNDSSQWQGTGPIRGEQGERGIQGEQGPAGTNGTNGATGTQGLPGINGTNGEDGIQGEQGPAGPKGDQGPAGNNGTDGAEGPAGIQGPAGVNGQDGSQGPAGNDGVAGEEGPAGAEGPAGPKGDQGTAGVNGQDGAEGSAGAEGPAGPKGDQGLAGVNGQDGEQGPEGPAGLTGTRGPKGDTGDTGPAGPAGPQGSQGFEGQKGETGVAGGQGPQGVQGPKGAGINVKGTAVSWPPDDNPSDVDLWILPNPTPEGTPVEYDPGDGVIWNADSESWEDTGPIRGETGIQGPQGPQGAPGLNGSDGDTGPQGIKGVDGIDGANGSNGEQGPEGIQGPQGDQGIPGVNGQDGAEGPQGPAGTNGAAGPQGTPGVNGSDGAEGPQGVPGEQGIQGEQGTAGVNGGQGLQGEQGPAGPTEVSSDADNYAIIGTDNKVYVPTPTGGGGGSDANALAFAKGAGLNVEQGLLAAAGQPAKTVLAVAATNTGKVQGCSLGNGNVVEVYENGAEYSASNVLYREFMGKGEPICFTGLSAGAIITSTQGFYGMGEQVEGTNESPMPLMSLGLSFTSSFLYAFRNSNNFLGAGNATGQIIICNGPLPSIVSLIRPNGSLVSDQQPKELEPFELCYFYTNANGEYILSGTSPIMAAIQANMGSNAPLNPGDPEDANQRFYDARLVMPLTNDGLTWPRSGYVSAPYANTTSKYYVRDGVTGDFPVLNPGSPVDFDATNSTGANDSDYEPRGCTRLMANGLVSAYSGADSAGLEASAMIPVAAMSQVVAQPFFIHDSGDGGNSCVSIGSTAVGTAKVYEWDAALGKAVLKYTVPLNRGETGQGIVPTTPEDQLVPCAGQVANEPTLIDDTSVVQLEGQLNPGYVEADVPITVVAQNSDPNLRPDIRSQNGTITTGFINDDDETLMLGWTPAEIKAEITTDTDGFTRKRVIDNTGVTTYPLT